MGTELSVRLRLLLEDYGRARARIEGLRAAADGMRVSVRAPDRSATVSVDATGRLVDLRLDPAVAGRLDAATLAVGILGASRLAAAQAREQLRSAMRRALPEPLRDLVGADGSVDLARALEAELAEAIRTDGGSRR
jgi:DNA-binding protein YbaB